MKNRQFTLRQLLSGTVVTYCLAGVLSPAIAADSQSTVPNATSTKVRKDSGSPFSAGSSSSSGSSSGYGLAQEWTPTNELKSYKQNYFLVFSHLSQPDYSPTSPNPAYQIPTPYTLQDKEVKFQISLKHILADFQRGGALWLGYTQLAFWQVYDQASAQPFREINYEPELIYSLRPTDASILNFGVNHQSLGQTNPGERSWNRVYIEPGIQFDIDAAQRMIVQIRWWTIIQEQSLNDNPDIGNFQGYRELNLRYIQDGGWKVNVLSRILSTQLDIAAPLSVWFLQPAQGGGNNVDIHLQYFNGYGEGLLEYNQSHVTLGVGISFPF